MKCKVCGYEFDSGREYCPMCGSKVPEDIRRKEEEEMSWNAYDFPKPKKPEDIEMRWPSMDTRGGSSVSVMKKDASEGFVRSASPARTEPQPEKKAEEPAPQAAPQPPQPDPSRQGAWQMPHMQETPAWTPYNVQPPQPAVTVPPISTAYIPTSFTQAYGPQYSQAQYTQPQTAWTVPPQPQPGQQVFVTQPAQPVYIQPAPVAPMPQPVYAPTYPVYTQPVPPQPAPQPPAPPAPEPVPAPQPEPQGKSEQSEKILEENVVAAIETPKEEPAKAEPPKEELPKEEPPLPEEKEEEIFPEPPEEELSGDEGRDPERFFTFNKKNEEFQQLLNQEYERLRSLHDGSLPEDFSRRFPYKKNTFQPSPAQDFFFDNEWSGDLSAFDRMLMEDTKDTEDSETLSLNRDRIKGAAASAEDLIDPLPVKPGDTHPLGESAPEAPEAPKEPAEEEPPAEPEIPKTKEEIARSEHRKRMEAMARAREAYFASLRTMTAEMRAIRDAEFKAQLEKEARVVPERVTREEVPEKEPEKTPEQIAAEKAEEERLAAQRDAQEREAAIAQAKAEMLAAQEAHHKEESEHWDELDEALRQAEEASQTETVYAPADDSEPAEENDTAPARNKTAVLGEILDDVDEANKKREKKENSHWFLKFLLVFALLIGAAEGGTIALRHFAPESPASLITTGIEQNVIHFVETSIDTIKSKFVKEESAPAPSGEPGQETGSGEGPVFVLSDVIAAYNKNIFAITENLGIGYDPQRTYEIPGLSASELVTDDAEKLAVCKTLISYNSSWVDYVSGNSQECLDYLKADGAAYRRAVTFDRIGQVTEEFQQLEIGEIRKTADSYFVFAGETIAVTEDGTTTPASGFVVYEMVPVGADLKILDYYDITN